MEAEVYTEINGKRYRLVRTRTGCRGCAFEHEDDMCPAIADEGICDAFSQAVKWEEVK